jgi:hypothetical protein
VAGPPTIPVRLFRDTQADWRNLAIELTSPVGRIVTLPDLAAALTVVGRKHMSEVRDALIERGKPARGTVQ